MKLIIEEKQNSILRNKAFHVLRTFSKKDVKNFNDFLLSPVFNKNKKVILLYKILSDKFHPHYNSEKLSRTFLKQKLACKTDSRLNDLFAVLHRLCLEYFSYLNMSEQKYEKDKFLMFELEKRGDYDLFKIHTENFLCKINNSGSQDITDFFYKYLIYKTQYNTEILYRKPKNPDCIKNYTTLLDHSANYLTGFWLENNISHERNFDSRSKKVSMDINEFASLKFFNLVFKKIGENEILGCVKSTLTKNECLLIDAITMQRDIHITPSIRKFDEVIAFLNKNKSELDINIRNLIFIELLNQIYSMANCNPEMEEYEMNFYTLFLNEKGYIIENYKYFSLYQFKFLLMRGFSFKDKNWIKNFFDDYILKVDPAYRTQLSNFYYAYSYFISKQYKKSLEHTAKVKLDFYIFKRDIKLLNAMVFFELEEWLSAIETCNKLKAFVKNQDIADEGKIPFIKFCDLVTRIISIIEKKPKYCLLEIKKQIENDKIIASKYWLLEKVFELS